MKFALLKTSLLVCKLQLAVSVLVFFLGNIMKCKVLFIKLGFDCKFNVFNYCEPEAGAFYEKTRYSFGLPYHYNDNDATGEKSGNS